MRLLIRCSHADPLFPLTVLMNSWLPGMLDALLQATFLCALLLFWLCIYHGLRQNERKFVVFYLPKLIVILPMWLCAVVLATWEKCNEMRDPTYSHFVDAGNYNVDPLRSLPMARVNVIVVLADVQNVLLRGRHHVFDVFGTVDPEGVQRTAIDAVLW